MILKAAHKGLKRVALRITSCPGQESYGLLDPFYSNTPLLSDFFPLVRWAS